MSRDNMDGENMGRENIDGENEDGENIWMERMRMEKGQIDGDIQGDCEIGYLISSFIKIINCMDQDV